MKRKASEIEKLTIETTLEIVRDLTEELDSNPNLIQFDIVEHIIEFVNSIIDANDIYRNLYATDTIYSFAKIEDPNLRNINQFINFNAEKIDNSTVEATLDSLTWYDNVKFNDYGFAFLVTEIDFISPEVEIPEVAIIPVNDIRLSLAA